MISVEVVPYSISAEAAASITSFSPIHRGQIHFRAVVHGSLYLVYQGLASTCSYLLGFGGFLHTLCPVRSQRYIRDVGLAWAL